MLKQTHSPRPALPYTSPCAWWLAPSRLHQRADGVSKIPRASCDTHSHAPATMLANSLLEAAALLWVSFLFFSDPFLQTSSNLRALCFIAVHKSLCTSSRSLLYPRLAECRSNSTCYIFIHIYSVVRKHCMAALLCLVCVRVCLAGGPHDRFGAQKTFKPSTLFGFRAPKIHEPKRKCTTTQFNALACIPPAGGHRLAVIVPLKTRDAQLQLFVPFISEFLGTIEAH